MTGSGMTTLQNARVETPSTESESQKASPQMDMSLDKKNLHAGDAN